MINLPEQGYTPLNLRCLLKHLGITQAQAAAYVGVSDRTMRLWLAEPEQTAKHSDMPLAKWRQLLQYPD